MGILPKIEFQEILNNMLEEEEKNKNNKFGKTFLIDFQKKKFLKKDGKLILTDDERSVRMYIEKVLLTVKDKYLIYADTDYGMEYQTNLRGRKYPNDFLKAEYIRELNEVLALHPRIQEITDLEIELKESTLYTAFNVILDDYKSFNWESEI